MEPLVRQSLQRALPLNAAFPTSYPPPLPPVSLFHALNRKTCPLIEQGPRSSPSELRRSTVKYFEVAFSRLFPLLPLPSSLGRSPNPAADSRFASTTSSSACPLNPTRVVGTRYEHLRQSSSREISCCFRTSSSFTGNRRKRVRKNVRRNYHGVKPLIMNSIKCMSSQENSKNNP